MFCADLDGGEKLLLYFPEVSQGGAADVGEVALDRFEATTTGRIFRYACDEFSRSLLMYGLMKPDH